MKPSSAKAKGRRLQKLVAESIIHECSLQPDDVRSTPMGCGGEDVLLSPRAREAVSGFSFECKCQERVNLWSAWEQAKANAGEHHPAVVIKKNHSDVLAVISFERFLALASAASTPAVDAAPAVEPAFEPASEPEVASQDPGCSNCSETTSAVDGRQMGEEGNGNTEGVGAGHGVQRPEQFGISSKRLADYMKHLVRSLV